MADTQRTVSIIVVIMVSVSGVNCKIRNVYWNTTTTSLSQGPLTVTVNEGNLPWEYDQLNLICPRGAEGEEHVIYSVDREEFEGCRVRGPRPRIVAVCNSPERFMYFTITFRSFTPTPGGWSSGRARSITSSPPPTRGTSTGGSGAGAALTT